MKRKLTFLTAALALLAFLAIPMGMKGQAPVNTVLWGETWTGGDAGETPSAYGFEGTTVYGDATLTYAQSSTNTKLYAEELAGGTSPELLLSKSNQTWTISNIPTGQATGMSLTFKSNKTTFAVTTTTSGITISGSQKSWTINVTGSADNFDLTIKNTGSSNARIDDIELKVTTAGASANTVATPSITPNGGDFLDSQEVSLSCATDGATIYYTTNGNDPTTSSTQYSAPFTITATTTVKAIAVKSGYTNSTIVTAEFVKVTPMSVAEARAAIDAGTGTEGVYVTGIVSSIVNAYSSQYNNISFNFSDDGETSSDQLEAFRCVSTDGADASTVAVGDIVVVYGNLTLYNNTTYEFTQGCQLVSLTHPTNYVPEPTFSPAAGTYDETQSVTISCTDANATIRYTLDGTDPTSTSAQYTAPIEVATTTTIKAIAYVGANASTVATATYTIVSPNNISDITEVGTAYIVQGTVVATNSRGFVMGDGTGYVYYYKNGTVSQSIGDMVKVSGTTGTYGQIIQFTNTATVTESTTSNYNNTPTASVITSLPDYTTGYHLSTYFEFEGDLSKSGSNYIVTLGGEEIQISYPTTEQGTALTALVGKNVRVKGYFTGINSSSKFTVMLESVEEVVSSDPTVTIANATIAVPAEGGNGTVTVTYTNFDDELELEVEFYEADGETTATYDWINLEFDTDHNVTYYVDANTGEARTAYFKVWETSYGVPSNLVTVNQAAYVAPTLDYATLPFEFDGGRADIGTTDGLTQEGLDSDYSSSPKLKFKTAGTWVLLKFNEAPGKLTFDIKGNSFSGGTFTVQTSEDGVTYTALATYTDSNFGNTLQNEEFNNLGENVRYIKWIYTEKSNGNVALGNIKLAKPSTDPVIVVTNNTIALDYDETSGEIEYSITNPVASSTLAANTEATWISNITVGSNAVTFTCTPNESTESRTATITLSYQGAEDVTVTVNQAAAVVPPTPGNWALTNLADLTANDVFVIVGTDSDTQNTYALPNDGGSSAPAATAITVVGSSLSGEPADNLKWNLSGNATDGYTFYPNGDAENWLYCSTTAASGSNNNIKIGTGDRKVFTFDEDGYMVTKDSNVDRYLSIYFNSGVAQDWRGYINKNSAVAISFYKKVDSSTATYPLDIAGYEDGSDGGYFLIASPVTVDPATVEGMILTGDDAANYDLYYFDESSDTEWRNYKQSPFNLEPGKGYLYAQKATTPGEVFHFTLTGTPYNGNGTIKLQKTGTGSFAGWNLIGNPFGETAYLPSGRDFYVMKDDGSEIIAGEGGVAAMQGVFVIANENNEEISFTTEDPGTTKERFVLNVSNNRGNVIDRAIVRFGEGQCLPKFQLNENSTKICIEENSNEYAVVYGEAEGTMPVSFKAEENGRYTINFNAENAEFSYLHLVDNMTGADVNLLENPSYSFDALTTDYSARFKVVYTKTTTGVSEDFAFVSNGSILVNGQGTLQVVDMTGRIVATYKDVNSISTKDMTPGVYVLQLIGNEVRTQKIVVK